MVVLVLVLVVLDDIVVVVDVLVVVDEIVVLVELATVVNVVLTPVVVVVVEVVVVLVDVVVLRSSISDVVEFDDGNVVDGIVVLVLVVVAAELVEVDVRRVKVLELKVVVVQWHMSVEDVVVVVAVAAVSTQRARASNSCIDLETVTAQRPQSVLPCAFIADMNLKLRGGTGVLIIFLVKDERDGRLANPSRRAGTCCNYTTIYTLSELGSRTFHQTEVQNGTST